MSSFWQSLFELSGTTLSHNTAYHPQTDGQSEVINRGLEQYLQAFTQEKPSSWFDLLSWEEFNYNTSYHSSLKMTPFQALYGRPLPIIPTYSPDSTSIQTFDELLHERDTLLSTLKANLKQAQHRMEQKANRHRCELHYNMGDLILVRLQPYRQTTLSRRVSQKLSKGYFGPFAITQHVGNVAYKLDLLEGCKIHPVFHVSVLKSYRGTSPDLHFPLPPKSIDNKPLLQPAAICATRNILHQGKVCQQILVQWTDSPPEDSTWEFFHDFSLLGRKPLATAIDPG